MIIGIDPGIKGAIAFYDPDLNHLRVDALPTKWRLINKKKRFEIDAQMLAVMIAECPMVIAKIVCERPHAMPGAGATSQFAFGKTCGMIHAVLELTHIPITYTDPSAWKRDMGCPSDKNLTRQLAQRHFPAHKSLFAKASDDGKAEAALLALYGVTRVRG